MKIFKEAMSSGPTSPPYPGNDHKNQGEITSTTITFKGNALGRI